MPGLKCEIGKIYESLCSREKEMVVSARGCLPVDKITVRRETSGACAYCGRLYEGYECPGCGAPRMEGE